MNIWRLLKYALFCIAAAALIALSHLYSDRALIVQYGEWRAAPSVAVAAAAALIAALALFFLFKFFSFLLFFPARIARWKKVRADKKCRETLEEGARALALDDCRRALGAFSRLSQKADADGVFAWLAAKSAEESGDRGARNEWLRRAAARGGADIAAAARAELAAEEGREGEAFDILTEAGAPNGSPLLAKMYLHSARSLGKWPQALAAAYRLRDSAPSRKRAALAAEIAEAALRKIEDAETLRQFWKNNVAAEEQKSPRLLSDYIRALHRLGDGETLAETLERAARTAPESPAVLSVIAAFGGEKLCETAFAAAQKRGDGGADPEYLRAAAMLAERLKLWGRARRYYQMANSLHPDPRNAAALDALESRLRPDEADAAPRR